MPKHDLPEPCDKMFTRLLVSLKKGARIAALKKRMRARIEGRK